MNVLIVDDEQNARALIKEFIATLNFPFEIYEAENAFEAAKILKKADIEIIFLDIGLPEKTGMELIEEIEHTAHIIFTTAYQDYAVKAFEINAADYLLKPFSEARFKESVERVLSKEKQDVQAIIQKTLQQFHQTGNYIERIAVREGKTLAIIKTKDIIAIEALSYYCKVIKNDRRSFVDSHSMSYFESVLDPRQFIRIHRSTIINLNYIDNVQILSPQKMIVKIKGGLSYDVSKSGQRKLKEIGSI